MKNLLKLLILFFVMYVLFQLIYFITSKGYEIEYKVDDFSVKEIRTKKTNKEIDNYYFEISGFDKTFAMQTYQKITNSQKVIEKIKSYKDDTYTCILPILKTNMAFSDIMCEKDGIYYFYNAIEGNDAALDDFAQEVKDFRKNFNNSQNIISNDGVIKVFDNFEDDLNLGIEYYKGVYLSNKKRTKKIQLLKNDVYTKDISTFVKNYYLIGDYNEKYEFHDFTLISLISGQKTIITSNKPISMYSYVQGVVDNSVYLIDPTSKKQYEINVKTKTIIEVGNEETGIKLYKDNSWTTGNIYDALNNKLLFENTKTFNNKEYARVDRLGGDKSGYYYLYEKKENIYNVYKVNVQKSDNLIYLFSTDNINNIIYSNDYLFYKNGANINYYHDSTGVRTLAEYYESAFNDSLQFGIVR